MSMEERSRLIQEEELRQTEEELAKAEGLVKQLEGLNLTAPTSTSSASSALVDSFAPMEDVPDWGDDELPPAPQSPIQTDAPLSAIPEETEQDQVMTPAPPTPPKSKFPATASWLGEVPKPKKALPPEFREPLVSVIREEYYQRKAE